MEYLLVVGGIAWTFFCIWVGHHLAWQSIREVRQEWLTRERNRLAKEAGRVVEAAIGEERAERLWNK